MSHKGIPLTEARLRELFSYDSETGQFARIKRVHGAVIGRAPGRLDRDGYLVVTIDYLHYRMHRLAWLYVFGNWPHGHIDHINGVTTDNRIQNLRPCTLSQNAANSKARLGRQFKGITQMRSGNFQVYLNRDYIGVFGSAEEAARAYDAAAVSVYGEYARLNFPQGSK